MESRQHISLLRLQSLIKSRLEEAMPVTFWVSAEISELKVNYSGHCYLELVEKGGDNQVPQAKVLATVWRTQWGMLSSYFRSATGGDLAVGMKVLLKGKVTYHELYGLAINVTDIDPLYTLGDMERRRQETILRLQQEGVYDMNRELGLPAVMQRIAVVSSRNAAGYQDFMNELAASGYYFDVTLFDAFMQGNEAENSVVAALERVADCLDDFDAVVVIRGGGSQGDLATFNSYRLSSHIAQFPLPVLTGIGHDKDQSVADLVAAVSLKTPTAVAAYLAANIAEFDGYLDTLFDGLARHSTAILDAGKRRTRDAAFRLSQAASGLTHTMELRLERLSAELVRRQEWALMQKQNRLTGLDNLLKSSVSAALTKAAARLALAEQMVESRKPDNILSLGFAIVRRGGAAVKSTDGVAVGDRLEITLSQGSVEANVESIKK